MIDAFINIQKYSSVKIFIEDHKHINSGALGIILTDKLDDHGNIGFVSFSHNNYKYALDHHKFGFEKGWNYDPNISIGKPLQSKEQNYILNPQSGYIGSTNKQ